MMSVAGVEKVQHLDKQISDRLANDELAKWDKLEAEIFSSDSQAKASAKSKQHHTVTHERKHVVLGKPAVSVQSTAHRAQVVSQPKKTPGAVFFATGSGKQSTDVRFIHKTDPVHAKSTHLASTLKPLHITQRIQVHVGSVSTPKLVRTQQKSLEVRFIVRFICFIEPDYSGSDIFCAHLPPSQLPNLPPSWVTMLLTFRFTAVRMRVISTFLESPFKGYSTFQAALWLLPFVISFLIPT
jgi:hypothetical protein